MTVSLSSEVNKIKGNSMASVAKLNPKAMRTEPLIFVVSVFA